MAFRDNCSGSVRKEIVKYENWALNLAQLQQQDLTGSHAPLLPPTHKWHQRAIDANTAMPMVPGGIARVVAEPALGHRSQHLPLGLTLLQMLGSKPHSKTLPFLEKGSSATHESQQPESNSPAVPARWKAPNLRQIFCQTSPGILQSHLLSCNRFVVK